VADLFTLPPANTQGEKQTKQNKTKTTTLKTKQSRGGEKKLCEKGGKMQALLAFWSG